MQNSVTKDKNRKSSDSDWFKIIQNKILNNDMSTTSSKQISDKPELSWERKNIFKISKFLKIFRNSNWVSWESKFYFLGIHFRLIIAFWFSKFSWLESIHFPFYVDSKPLFFNLLNPEFSRSSECHLDSRYSDLDRLSIGL